MVRRITSIIPYCAFVSGVGVLLGLCLLCFSSCGSEKKPVVLIQFYDGSSSPEPFGNEGHEVTVLVYGEVKKPGAYRLPRGARKLNAIEMAGGVTAASDLSGLKLFSLVEPGEMIFIPTRMADPRK
jgi:hypothetical protein